MNKTYAVINKHTGEFYPDNESPRLFRHLKDVHCFISWEMRSFDKWNMFLNERDVLRPAYQIVTVRVMLNAVVEET